MAKSKKQTKGEKNIEAVEGAISKTEQFLEHNQNLIIWIVGAIVLIAVGYIGYTRYILEPRENEASAEIFMAESYFEKDSLNQAIYGDGVNYGFLDIIDNYKFTKTANLAKYYAGISYLRMGDYEEAIDYLKKYRKRDQVIGSMAYGAIGDVYVELGQYKEAINYYTKAFRHESDHFTAPIFIFRAAQINEYIEDYNQALSLYNKIQEEYPQSQEARNIEIYIAKMQAKVN